MDLVKRFPTRLWSRRSASIQSRTDRSKLRSKSRRILINRVRLAVTKSVLHNIGLGSGTIVPSKWCRPSRRCSTSGRRTGTQCASRHAAAPGRRGQPSGGAVMLRGISPHISPYLPISPRVRPSCGRPLARACGCPVGYLPQPPCFRTKGEVEADPRGKARGCPEP